MIQLRTLELGIEAPRELADVRRFSHEAMATVFEVHAVHADGRYAAQAAQAAFDLVDRLERELSRFIPNSDIGRINQLAPGERTRVAPTTLECLVIARHAFELTGGAFDVSIGTGLRIAGAGHRRVRRSERRRRGVKIDLGGVGKGYAVDLMAEVLEEWGVERALVHGGFSSVLALEPPPGLEGWPLTLSTPGAKSRVLATVSPRQTAMGASGVRKADHIVDPRTGEPVRDRRRRLGRRAEAAAGKRRAAPRGRRDQRRADDGVHDVAEGRDLGLCDRAPGTEAWILEGGAGDDRCFSTSVVAWRRLPVGYYCDRQAFGHETCSAGLQACWYEEDGMADQDRETRHAAEGRTEKARSPRPPEGALDGPRTRALRVRLAEAAARTSRRLPRRRRRPRRRRTSRR